MKLRLLKGQNSRSLGEHTLTLVSSRKRTGSSTSVMTRSTAVVMYMNLSMKARKTGRRDIYFPLWDTFMVKKMNLYHLSTALKLICGIHCSVNDFYFWALGINSRGLFKQWCKRLKETASVAVLTIENNSGLSASWEPFWLLPLGVSSFTAWNWGVLGFQLPVMM